tara:strand:+ start:1108 stop:1494 length:387 start_codon:yes stop_codon:yes gene_type:complete
MKVFNIVNLLLVAFIVIFLDSIFLFLMKNRFRKQLQKITGKPFTINISGVIACYIILVFGLYYFVIYKNLSLFDSALMGFIIYGVYETTNMATFVHWNIVNAIIDSIWGAILFVLTKILFNKIKLKLT